MLSENQRDRVLEVIVAAKHPLQGLKLDNSQRSQVLALLGAAKGLAERDRGCAVNGRWVPDLVYPWPCSINLAMPTRLVITAKPAILEPASCY